MNEEKMFLNVNDVSKYMSISVPMAYKIIKKLNSELNKKGYITISGKVNRYYFEEKVYGSPTRQGGESYGCL